MHGRDLYTSVHADLRGAPARPAGGGRIHVGPHDRRDPAGDHSAHRGSIRSPWTAADRFGVRGCDPRRRLSHVRIAGRTAHAAYAAGRTGRDRHLGRLLSRRPPRPDVGAVSDPPAHHRALDQLFVGRGTVRRPRAVHQRLADQRHRQQGRAELLPDAGGSDQHRRAGRRASAGCALTEQPREMRRMSAQFQAGRENLRHIVAPR